MIVLKTFHLVRECAIKISQKKALNDIWKSTVRGCNLRSLTKEQCEEIQAYWKPLVGHKVSTKWHQLIFSVCGVFTPRYEPFEVCMKVQDILSPSKYRQTLDDKGLYHNLLTDFNFPARIAERVNGVYYLPSKNGRKELTFDSFVKGLSEVSDAIIKPSVGTDGGRGVESFDTAQGIMADSNISVRDYLLNYQDNVWGRNYCIEQKIHECYSLQSMNPTSCNTLRIHTFRDRENCRIEIASAYLRIGRKGKVTDNAYSGGICAKIDADGYLTEAISVYPYKVYTMTESGVNIKGFHIENFSTIKDTVVAAHSSLPMFDLMGWDVTIDDDGNVIIIEFNPNPDVRIEQCIFKDTCLLDKQERIIKQVYGRK